ncbi:RimK family alpha-L-glutamate ligase [Persicimonas caeni]|uniref:RimK family alpha-L-glutamate ligase n=1 Tax=Persicimonas caeni TaxID=2292766 RepID=A0A4Y6PNY5_PERCE|nr:RimK family alpha-L-glutamate ligase [Persicimonas caeni]QDG50014.1 RimK family alpha-L-glutamate ligase [Persicimonas caeni]QED31235.1 RimK family alpha-L-glutamate ligase [Persicimonas caeni]
MKLAILSRGRTLYSTRRLAEVGRKRKHDVRIIDPVKCTVSMGAGHLSTQRDGMNFEGYDCVIPRIGGGSSSWGLTLLRQIELQGIRVLNPAFGTMVAADKVQAMQELAAAGVPTPTTLQTKSTDDLPALIAQVNGPPVILKLLKGTQGVGVIKVDTVESAVSTLEALWSLREDVLIQEFVAESTGVDIRAFVVDGKVVGAMERTAREGEFRANVHRGGSTRKVDLDDEAREVALRAANALGLRVAGVDLLPSTRGPLVIEVNASPGLEGIEGATGRDIAKDIIKCVERLAD